MYTPHTFLAISFTLKGQSFAQIKEVLKQIAELLEKTGEKPILVHGHMPKHIVLEKGFPTEMVDALAEIFPLQLNCYCDGKIAREAMSDIIYEFGGVVHVIGEVKDGVAEEVALYESKGLHIIYHQLPTNTL